MSKIIEIGNMQIGEASKVVRETFASQLKDCMELSNMSQIDLARESGLESSRISTWLNGKCLPSVPAILILASKLGVSVELLTLGEE